MKARRVLSRFLLAAGWGLVAVNAWGRPVDFSLEAQRADSALLAFSKLTKMEVLFSFDELRKTRSSELTGRYAPEDALHHLLQGTGFSAQRSGGGKYVVTRAQPALGGIKGRLVLTNGTAARGIRVTLPDLQQTVTTNQLGEFEFAHVRPGPHRLVASGAGLQALITTTAPVEADQVLILETNCLSSTTELTQLAPFVVKAKSPATRSSQFDERALPPRTATGNLDVVRTNNDALPHTVYDRNQIIRSGAVNLNEFLQRELLDIDAATQPPEQDASSDRLFAGSTNLKLRGYEADETVVLVNGRRLPEILTSSSGRRNSPDVNLIPLSLIQQIEVLPVSASALYSGNPVGGVINILLRSDAGANATELSATYTNAVGRFNAPQSTVSLLHGETLLNGTGCVISISSIRPAVSLLR